MVKIKTRESEQVDAYLLSQDFNFPATDILTSYKRCRKLTCLRSLTHNYLCCHPATVGASASLVIADFVHIGIFVGLCVKFYVRIRDTNHRQKCNRLLFLYLKL